MKKIVVTVILVLSLFALVSCGKKYNQYYSENVIVCYEDQIATIDMYTEGKIDLSGLKREMKAIYNKYHDLDSSDIFLRTAASFANVIYEDVVNYEFGQKLGTGTLVELEKEIKNRRQEIEDNLYE